ncbi:YraN family protein [Limihaloglobus sulfuriphilus]|uniref:YraN family protein n=1 Tax=Limihaloglobus sulfuriphilus TaxID=1851148 RepID=UPI001649D84A|nr:YraN family protein [Limihaloglobus sulfuriphilus]
MLFKTTYKKLLSSTRVLGRWGERKAVKYLKGKGYSVLALNYRCKAGEIDAVMSTPEGVIVFVEVKSRRKEGLWRAVDAVTRKKQRKIAASAKFFKKRYKCTDLISRFDIVTVVLDEKKKPKITHYENAFYA